MLGIAADRAAAKFEIYCADQHTLVIPVGPLATEACASDSDASEDADSVPLPYGAARSGSVRAPYAVSSGEDPTDCDSDRSPAPRTVARDGIQIICRYDSAPAADCPPPTSCLQPAAAAPAVDIGDFSSIVEIDGDCVIIHSRQDEAATAEEAPVDVATPISERCRRFYESRLRSRRPSPFDADRASDSDDPDSGPSGPTSVDSGRESGPDSGGGGGGASHHASQKPLKPASSLQTKMALLRREMWSLMHQDDDLFRQLLALNDSIEALKQVDAASLSPASSLSSLPELADESCSPSSTLSSASSGRQSHLSTDSGNYALIRARYRSQPQLSAEFLTIGDGGRLTSSRSFCEMSPPSPRQTTPPSLRALDKLRPPGGRRKQGSFDSGIVDQELRDNT